MLAAIIAQPSTDKALQEALKISSGASLIELRLDTLTSFITDDINTCCSKVSKPIILTYRRTQEGGSYNGNDQIRISRLLSCLIAKPAYLDIEHDLADDLFRMVINTVAAISPTTKIIRSYHNLNHTPKNLDSILQSMQNPNIAIYKIVSLAQKSIDGLTMLDFIQRNNHLNICGHCMGSDGIFTRYLSSIMGSIWSYAAPNNQNKAIAGIPTINDFNIYRHSSLNNNTSIYALLGDPIDHSKGHIFHNEQFSKNNINAIYVKISCDKQSITPMLSKLSSLPFKGLSITMPLKESVANQGAYNTMIKIGDTWKYSNTDGPGACQALLAKTKLAGKSILVLGAGGTARGIIKALKQYDCILHIANRTQSKAQHLKNMFSIKLMDWINIDLTGIDIIISTLHPEAYLDIKWLSSWSHYICSQHVVMDVNYAVKHSPILQQAASKNAACIYGEDLFLQQALGQQQCWQL